MLVYIKMLEVIHREGAGIWWPPGEICKYAGGY